MSSSKKRRENFTEKLEISRRNFLAGGSAMATSAAMLMATAAPAHAVVNGRVSPLIADQTGSAHIKRIEYSDSCLGTSRIVGPIEYPSQMEMGFSRVARGLVGETEEIRKENQMEFISLKVRGQWNLVIMRKQERSLLRK